MHYGSNQDVGVLWEKVDHVHCYCALQLISNCDTEMFYFILLVLVSKKVWLADGSVSVSRSAWVCQFRLLVVSFISTKAIWDKSSGSSAAVVNHHCDKEKDAVTAGSENESDGSRCLA